MKQKKPISIVIGACLMILLGIARGIGGMVLFIRGGKTLPDIRTSESILWVLAFFLVLIGLLEIVSAVGILHRKRFFWIMGIIVTFVFVIDGAVNGYFIFGKPGDLGTLVNCLMAVLIIANLYQGKRIFSQK